MQLSSAHLCHCMNGLSKLCEPFYMHVIETVLVEMLQHSWASGSSQTLDYRECTFMWACIIYARLFPAASKECHQ